MSAAPASNSAANRGHRAAAGEGERLRTQLLDAAERLLGQKGSVDAVSLRQVAAEVGVTATSVYLHFQDKNDLIIGVCSRRFQALRQIILQARDQHDTPIEQIRACGAAYVRFGLAWPVEYLVLFGAIPLEIVMERVPLEEQVGSQVLQEMADLVQRGIAAGDLRPVDPMTTALSLWAVTHGLVGALTIGHDKPEVSLEDLVDQTLDLVLYGLVLPE
ncbi:MAG: TetR/AcrR family transcriptional regulator [Euzebya sp.]